MAGARPLSLIEGLEPGVVVFSSDFRIHWMNRTMFRIFGDTSATTFFERGVMDLHQEKTQPRIVDALRQAQEAQREVPLNLKLVTHLGSDRYLLVKLIPLLDAELASSMCMALIYDISSLVTDERRLVRIPVSLNEEISLLRPEEIVFVRAANIYSEVRTASGFHHCDLPIGALEKRLSPDQFVRVHRSYLVNVGFVRKVDRDHTGCVVEVGRHELRLPVSRSKVSEFLAAVGLA